jgi:phage gp29-like protein
VRKVLVDESGLNLSDRIYDILDGIRKGFSATEIEWDTEKRLNCDLW